MGTKGYGSATITATAGGKTATCTITGKVTYTSLSAGSVLHVGDTFYSGTTIYYKNGKQNASFSASHGVITLIQDGNYYRFKRGSDGTTSSSIASVKTNSDGVYISGGSGTSNDRFVFATHTN